MYEAPHTHSAHNANCANGTKIATSMNQVYLNMSIGTICWFLFLLLYILVCDTVVGCRVFFRFFLVFIMSTWCHSIFTAGYFLSLLSLFLSLSPSFSSRGQHFCTTQSVPKRTSQTLATAVSCQCMHKVFHVHLMPPLRFFPLVFSHANRKEEKENTNHRNFLKSVRSQMRNVNSARRFIQICHTLLLRTDFVEQPKYFVQSELDLFAFSNQNKNKLWILQFPFVTTGNYHYQTSEIVNELSYVLIEERLSERENEKTRERQRAISTSISMFYTFFTPIEPLNGVCTFSTQSRHQSKKMD